jgi:hypothetical protein
MQITFKKLGAIELMGDAKTPSNGQVKTTADLFAERYFQQFGEVRTGGLFGPGRNTTAAEPEAELEAE